MNCVPIFSISVAGELYEIARDVYNLDLSISILESKQVKCGRNNVMVRFRLDFDNLNYVSLSVCVCVCMFPLLLQNLLQSYPRNSLVKAVGEPITEHHLELILWEIPCWQLFLPRTPSKVVFLVKYSLQNFHF